MSFPNNQFVNQRPPDTTSKLWDIYYQVRVPYMLSRTKEDIERFGTVISGIKDIDDGINKEWISTEMPIATMVEYYRHNVGIKVRKQKDVEEIYKAISDHIHVWKERLARGINIGDAPVDDLILLDRFAATIFEHAKYHFTDDEANSLMARHLGNIQRVNAHTFFSKKDMTVTGQNVSTDSDGNTRINAEEKLPERDSLGEFFKTRLMNLRRG